MFFTATFFPMLGEDEVWQLINLTGDTHPMSTSRKVVVSCEHKGVLDLKAP